VRRVGARSGGRGASAHAASDWLRDIPKDSERLSKDWGAVTIVR